MKSKIDKGKITELERQRPKLRKYALISLAFFLVFMSLTLVGFPLALFDIVSFIALIGFGGAFLSINSQIVSLKTAPAKQAKLEFWKRAVSGVVAFCLAFAQVALSIYEIRLTNPAYVPTSTLPFTAGALFLTYVYYYIFTDYFAKKTSGYATLGIALLLFLGGGIAAIVFFLLLLIGAKISGKQPLSNKMMVYYGVMSLIIAGLVWYLLGI